MKYFESLEPMVLLKLHKYFFWADKKLHSVFFIEDKDQISEDLLVDFKSDEDNKAFVKSKALAEKKVAKKDTGPKNIEVDRAKNRITKEDMFGVKQKKFVAIDDDFDFPDLSDDDMPVQP